ncbi:MAG: hypothetical protein WCX17_03510 [Parcubacteria group bacterium]|jgi:hypothetical protein
MSDDLLVYLQKGLGRLKSLEKARKKNIILGGITLALSMGLFFSAFPGNQAIAKNQVKSNVITNEVIDPLNRINKGVIKDVCVEDCERQLAVKELDQIEAGLNRLLSKHPISAMVPYIAKRDKKVAAYLVAIAKKESDWGKHTPKKNGRECYNFWGYRGRENTTESGYSCFKDPEQAVKIVGDKIEKLIKQKINTPERMIVWKCGRTCAGHDPRDVRKWISDVAFYYGKIISLNASAPAGEKFVSMRK